MAKHFTVGAGNKVKLFVGNLVLSYEPPADRTTLTPPSDELGIQPDAPVNADSTTITLTTALTNPVPAGTALKFEDNNASPAFFCTVFVMADALPGSNSLTVAPVKMPAPMVAAGITAIPATATADYIGLLRVKAGTQTSLTNNTNSTDTQVFEDDLGYDSSVVTSQNWEIPWTANFMPDDPAFSRIRYASDNAVKGSLLYVRLESPAPTGYTTGEVTDGIVTVQSLTRDFPADGIVTYNCTFAGQGAPKYTPYA